MAAATASPFERDAGLARIALLVAVLVALSVLPLAQLLGAAFLKAGAVDFSGSLRVLASRSVVTALQNTLVTGIVSATLALLLGGAAALAVATTDMRGKRSFGFLFVLSMMMAPQVVALAYIAATGPTSPLLLSLGLAPSPGTPNPLRGPAGIIAVLALHHAPLAFITLRAGLRQVPRELVEAAQIDGANAFATIRLVLAPLLRGHLVAAGLLCFVAAIGNFGIPALLGLPANYLTLTTLIYRRLTSLGPDVIGDMAALSLILAILAGLGVAGARICLRRAMLVTEAGRELGVVWPLARWRVPVEGAMGAVIALTLLVPLISLLTAALVPTYGVALRLDTLTLANVVEVLWVQDVTLQAFRNSFLFAGAAALIVAAMALPIAHLLVRRFPGQRVFVEGLFELPYALPGIVLAVATILIFLRPLPLVGVSLYGTAFIIVFAYVARFFALALKPVAATLAQIDPAVEEAASLCGAGALQRLRYIILPLAGPSLVSGALMVFLVAFNELTVSALLWAPGTQTIGVVLFNLEEAGLASQAAVIGLAATLAVAAIMLVIDAIGARHGPDAVPWR
jgi:iron(III) transport system permease protein